MYKIIFPVHAQNPMGINFIKYSQLILFTVLVKRLVFANFFVGQRGKYQWTKYLLVMSIEYLNIIMDS